MSWSRLVNSSPGRWTHSAGLNRKLDARDVSLCPGLSGLRWPLHICALSKAWTSFQGYVSAASVPSVGPGGLSWGWEPAQPPSGEQSPLPSEVSISPTVCSSWDRRPPSTFWLVNLFQLQNQPFLLFTSRVCHAVHRFPSFFRVRTYAGTCWVNPTPLFGYLMLPRCSQKQLQEPTSLRAVSGSFHSPAPLTIVGITRIP